MLRRTRLTPEDGSECRITGPRKPGRMTSNQRTDNMLREAYLAVAAFYADRHKNLRLRHLGGMADVVEEDEPPDPVAIRVLGAGAVVTAEEGLSELVEELGLPLGS